MTSKTTTIALVLVLLGLTAAAGGSFWWISQILFGDVAGSPAPPKPERELTRFSDVPRIPSGAFKYGGSTTWAEIRPPALAAIQSAAPNFKLIYTDPSPESKLKAGSGTGIQMLINGQLTFSLSSRSLKDKDFETAKLKRMQLGQIPVAIDGIAIAANNTLNLKGLTLEQLKNIYAGKITNWQEVGGPNLKITPYSRGSEGGTVDFFKERLELKDFGKNVVLVDTTTEGIQKVSQDPGGIYYASAPEVVSQCAVETLPIGEEANALVPPYTPPLLKAAACLQQKNVVNTPAFNQGLYPLTRKLFVIVNNNGKTEQRAGETYANMLLTQEGQDLIEKTGFVKIRK